MNDIEHILRKIAEEIEISQEEFERAIKSYNAVGTYLNNNITESEIKIVPQGSFSLGTAIKPITDEDEYDIDIVAIMDNKFSNPCELKMVVGKALKKSDRYADKLMEGKRCWTIEYADSSKFHIDILPTMKSDTYSVNKQLIMTHRDGKNYDYEFRTTNPEAYYDWFVSKIKNEKKKLIEDYAYRNQMEVNSVPYYAVKTNLQIAIELLKRYRDIKFKNDPEQKPISIIITTIMAKVYTDGDGVFELIEKFSREYINFLEKDDNGNIIIRNPVNSSENFADKWQKYPDRKDAFFRFINDLRTDLVENSVLINGSQIEQADIYKTLFGENVIKRVYENEANEMRIARENGKVYIRTSGNITKEKTSIKVKEHSFYGK